MSALPPVCILAGGLGTRLGEKVATTPKPLLEVAGEPFLMHQLRLLAQNGAERVVLCVGYLGEQIEERIGVEQFGIQIEYSYDAPGLDGTLGAIRRALPLLSERFLVLYGDTYLRLNYADAARTWKTSGCRGMMTVLRNDDRWDFSNVVFENERIVAYDKQARTPEMHWIDYGLGGLEASAIELVPSGETDLVALYKTLTQREELFGYEVFERFYEIGSSESLAEADEFLRSLAGGQAT